MDTNSHYFKGKNVLILGGLGFIGSNLAHRLVQLKANVTLIDSMLTQYGGNLENISGIENKISINFSDIRDRHSLKYIVKNQDIIFSMAGQTSHIESMHDPFTDLDINCTSQLSLLEACRHENPDAEIIYASTRQIYGRPQYLPVDENHPISPVDVNGINKFAAEMYYSLYTDVYSMKCTSIRLTNTYGPRQHLSGNNQGFAGIFIRKALSGEKITVFGDGTQLRDFNYIEDVINAFLVVCGREDLYGSAYNLGHHNHYSLIDFIEALQRFTQFEYELVPFPEAHKKIDIGDYYSDYSLFKQVTSWVPETDLTEGLKQTVAYFEPLKSKYWKTDD